MFYDNGKTYTNYSTGMTLQIATAISDDCLRPSVGLSSGMELVGGEGKDLQRAEKVGTSGTWGLFG